MVEKKKVQRRKKKKVNRVSVSQNTKYYAVVFFFVLSLLLTRFVVQKVSHSIEEVKTTKKLECETEYDFTPVEGELLKISKFIHKPQSQGQFMDPCLDQVNNILASYSLEKRNTGANQDIRGFSKELKKRNKIKKLAVDIEEPVALTKRIEKLNTSLKKFQKDYPRFEISDKFPAGAINFGVVASKIPHLSEFLAAKKCQKPRLHFAHHKISYLSLFFTLNAVRGYQGRVELQNTRLKTLIEGKFGVFEYQREPFHRHLPFGYFEMWSHSKMKTNFGGHSYQRQSASQEYRFDWDRSPWLYNECNQAISTISNYCGLDPKYDMQMKDFFYVVRRDMIIGNIYCKKSYQKDWRHIAEFEFLRTN